MGKRPEIEIISGELSGKRYSIPAGALRLGRSSSNDIHISDEELSRNHCLFEAVDAEGLRLTDLASANGTLLNGKPLGNDPVMLKDGDLIEAGSTMIRVIGEKPATPPPPQTPTSVDLGLGKPDASKAQKAPRRRSPIANILWLFALAAAGAAIYLALTVSVEPEKVSVPTELDENPPVEEVWYEKVEATQNGICRFELTLSTEGLLKVEVDDVPTQNRHVTKSVMLDEKARAEVNDILSLRALREVDREYVGAEPDPPALESWSLKVVYATRVRTVRILNTQEPPAFRAIREKLEAFSKNLLGVWALQYSREKLVALAEEAVALGKAKWEDREVQHGNLAGAIKAYEEAIFYLETVNPKPDCIQDARKGLELARTELDQRYSTQRFLADRAINLKQWETARRELLILLELVPDRADDRNREASVKLVDVENRMKGAK